MPCCCLNCPSADTYDSSGYLLCYDSACITPLRVLPSVDTHESSGYLLCRAFACIATLRILMMLVAIEVAISIYYLKGIAESGIHKF